MALGTALLIGAQLGQGILSSVNAKRKEQRRRRMRTSFFENELSPLLEDAQVNPNDIDYGSIREAELDLPLVQMQNQMRQISKNRDTVLGKSGLQSNQFVNDNVTNDINLTNTSFDNQVFNVDKSLIDLQSQLESIANQNKLQAKQLEYEYKYG